MTQPSSNKLARSRSPLSFFRRSSTATPGGRKRARGLKAPAGGVKQSVDTCVGCYNVWISVDDKLCATVFYNDATGKEVRVRPRHGFVIEGNNPRNQVEEDARTTYLKNRRPLDYNVELQQRRALASSPTLREAREAASRVGSLELGGAEVHTVGDLLSRMSMGPWASTFDLNGIDLTAFYLMKRKDLEELNLPLGCIVKLDVLLKRLRAVPSDSVEGGEPPVALGPKFVTTDETEIRIDHRRHMDGLLRRGTIDGKPLAGDVSEGFRYMVLLWDVDHVVNKQCLESDLCFAGGWPDALRAQQRRGVKSVTDEDIEKAVEQTRALDEYDHGGGGASEDEEESEEEDSSDESDDGGAAPVRAAPPPLPPARTAGSEEEASEEEASEESSEEEEAVAVAPVVAAAEESSEEEEEEEEEEESSEEEETAPPVVVDRRFSTVSEVAPVSTVEEIEEAEESSEEEEDSSEEDDAEEEEESSGDEEESISEEEVAPVAAVPAEEEVAPISEIVVESEEEEEESSSEESDAPAEAAPISEIVVESEEEEEESSSEESDAPAEAAPVAVAVESSEEESSEDEVEIEEIEEVVMEEIAEESSDAESDDAGDEVNLELFEMEPELEIGDDDLLESDEEDDSAEEESSSDEEGSPPDKLKKPSSAPPPRPGGGGDPPPKKVAVADDDDESEEEEEFEEESDEEDSSEEEESEESDSGMGPVPTPAA